MCYPNALPPEPGHHCETRTRLRSGSERISASGLQRSLLYFTRFLSRSVIRPDGGAKQFFQRFQLQAEAIGERQSQSIAAGIQGSLSLAQLGMKPGQAPARLDQACIQAA